MTKPPAGLGLLGYVSSLKTPLRVKDLTTHPESVGLPQGHPPMNTFLGLPIYHLEEHVGNLYLTEKGNGLEFNDEDQHIAAMMAAQAATVIANSRRLEQEHRARTELEALMDISPVSVSVFDPRKGAITYMNQECQRILGELGIPEEKLENSYTFLRFSRTDGRAIPFHELPGIRALQTGEVVRADEIVVSLPNGNSISTLVSCAPLFSESGEIVSVMMVIQDMTPLEDMERRRGEFLGMVSEELRTPLTTIKGSAMALNDIAKSTGAGEALQLLRIIDQQSDLMRSQVNSLIELTQIETGTLSINTETADVAGLIERSCAEYLGEYAALAIQLDIPDDLPMVAADRRRITQVLHNFLRQAAKLASESSPIMVSASAVDIYVSISVSAERHVGHSEKEQEMAVSPFRSPDSPQYLEKVSLAQVKAIEQHTQGEGLATAFCRGVVEAHGGRIRTEVDEQEGRVTLTFTLPTVDGELETPALDVPDLSPQRLPALPETAQIVVSIENFKLETTVRKVLQKAGYGSISTPELHEVELYAASGTAKLILMDIAGREEDCFRTLLRARESSNLPAIVLCDRDDDEYVVRAFEMGADGYMVKPFSPSEMIARIKAALRRSNVAGESRDDNTFRLGDVLVNFNERTVNVSGQPVQLTATEYKLLNELASSAGRVLTQDMLLERIWGPEYLGEPQLLRSYVKSLRQKLGDNARSPSYIFTEHGVGYRMAKPRPTVVEAEPAVPEISGAAVGLQRSKRLLLRNGAGMAHAPRPR